MRKMVGSTDEFLTRLPHLIASLDANHVWVIFFFILDRVSGKKGLVVSV